MVYYKEFLLKEFLLCVVSAVLLILSFPAPNLWLCAWGGFVPLFFVLENKNKWKAFLSAYMTGVIFWAGIIYWLVHVTLAGTIVLILYLALYFGLFGFLCARFRLLSSPAVFVTAPALWVLLEYLRSRLLTGFGWALLGYSQYTFVPLIQSADISGVWGVSFLVMFINAAIYSLCGYRFLVVGTKRVYLAVAVVIIAAYLYGVSRMLQFRPGKGQSYKEASVAVVQPDIAQKLKWDRRARSYILNTYTALTQEAARGAPAPDLIVWPEAALPGIWGEDSELAQYALDQVKSCGVPLLLGAVRAEGGAYFNSAILMTSGGGIHTVYDKLHLVPFGEYIPLKRWLPFLETIAPIGDIAAGKDYIIFDHDGMRYAALVCFEDVFPELSRRFVLRGARFLVNITNDAWYNETSAAEQHFQASVFRAVENRVYLARAANTGISAIIRPDGTAAAMVKDAGGKPIFVRGFAVSGIPLNGKTPRTLYTRFGDWFIAAAALMLVCGIARGAARGAQ